MIGEVPEHAVEGNVIDKLGEMIRLIFTNPVSAIQLEVAGII
tara:strand:+ start:468 stop:593 length:126 start_codon:yes stop_codon:yes gene_type:complete